MEVGSLERTPQDGAPFFSVIVPAFNRAETISRAVASCLAQTFADFELIVVDDGSEDDTEARVRASPDPRVRYLRQQNAGAAAARNRGADHAAGRYLAFLDSDDEFLPGKLAAFHAAIAAAGASEQTVWYAPLLFARENDLRSVKPPRAIREDESVGDYLFAFDGLMQTSTLVLPRPLFARVRFDPALRSMQDLDLCLRLERAGARFRMLPEPQSIWHDHTAGDRISSAAHVDQIARWAEGRRSLMSDRAYHGFHARFVAMRLMRSDPRTAIGLVLRGLRHRSLSPFRATSIVVRGSLPGTYSLMRDWLMRQAQRSQP